MSENSLIVRQKYISKLFDKVESLQEGIQLLEKVDRKIFKKNMFRTIQAGGGNPSATNNSISIKGLESEALVTKIKLEQQKGVIEKARQTIETLNTGLAGVRSSLEQLHKLMQDINDNINIVPLGDAKLPDLSSYGKQTLYNAFKNKPYEQMVQIPDGNTDDLFTLLGNDSFSQLITVDKGISPEEYTALLARLHGAGPGAPTPPAPQVGGFFSSFFMPKNNENSVTSSEMPFTAQNLYSETSNY